MQCSRSEDDFLESSTPKAICTFNTILTKISTAFFFLCKNVKSHSSNSYGLCRKPQLVKTILFKKKEQT